MGPFSGSLGDLAELLESIAQPLCSTLEESQGGSL